MPHALVVRENKQLVIEEIELPKYGPKDLLIKVTHVAQNPTDWKHVHFGFAKPGSIVGCDFAGEVVQVGSEAIGNYKPGDHVAGCVHGGIDHTFGIFGAFSEYVVQDASLVFRYPNTLCPEAAATIPLASVTAALALFHEMKLPFPPANCGTSVLVWGGSTSVGQYAIQLAKAAGCFVITTASSARHDYLKTLGADICFDYKDPNVVAHIKDASKNSLAYAMDCVSENGSTTAVCDTLCGANAQIATVLPGVSKEVPRHVTERMVMMYSIFGRETNVFGFHFDARPRDKEFAEKYYLQLTNVLLPNGLLKPNKVTHMSGGLKGIEEGFKKMMDNKIAAEKLVYTLAETK